MRELMAGAVLMFTISAGATTAAPSPLARLVPTRIEVRPDHRGYRVHFDGAGPVVTVEIPRLEFDAARRRPVLWTAPDTDQEVLVADLGLINLEADALDLNAGVMAAALTARPERPALVDVINGPARRAALTALERALARFTAQDPDPENAFVDTFGITRADPDVEPAALVGVQIQYDRRAVFTRPDFDTWRAHLGTGYPVTGLPSPAVFMANARPTEEGRRPGPRVAELIVTRGSLGALAPPLRQRLLMHAIRRATARGCAWLLTDAGPVESARPTHLGFLRTTGDVLMAELNSRNLNLRIVAVQRGLEGRRP